MEYPHFSLYLRRSMANRPQNQIHVAKCCWVTRANVSGWVRGVRAPTPDRLAMLASAIDGFDYDEAADHIAHDAMTRCRARYARGPDGKEHT